MRSNYVMYELEQAIKEGRVDVVKAIIQSRCINDPQWINISGPDYNLYIFRSAIFWGYIDVFKFFTKEAHLYGLPKIDFNNVELNDAAQKACREVRQYFEGMKILQNAGIDLESITDELVADITEIAIAQRNAFRL